MRFRQQTDHAHQTPGQANGQHVQGVLRPLRLREAPPVRKEAAMPRSRHVSFRQSAGWAGAVLCAATLTGCSINKLAMKDEATPKIGKPPEVAVSVPGSPEFGTPRELKRPERVHVAYGRWQEQQRQPALAREAYQKALEHDPKSVEALLGLARLDQLAGRHEEAERHLQRAQQLHPQEPLVFAGWGEFYAAQEKWPQAIERYQQAIKLAPDEPLFKHQLGVAQVKSGAITQGLASFTAAVGEAEAHYNVGVLLYQQGRVVEAEQHLQRALALKPELAPASKMLAKIQQQRSGTTPMADKAPTFPAPTAPVVMGAGAVAPAPSLPAAAGPAVAPAAVMAAPSPPPAQSAVVTSGWTAAPASPPSSQGWTAARTTDVQPAQFTTAPLASPQQEQWQNQR